MFGLEIGRIGKESGKGEFLFLQGMEHWSSCPQKSKTLWLEPDFSVRLDKIYPGSTEQLQNTPLYSASNCSTVRFSAMHFKFS
jgi:hypothetical protein